jgi:hypothetical protein
MSTCGLGLITCSRLSGVTGNVLLSIVAGSALTRYSRPLTGGKRTGVEGVDEGGLVAVVAVGVVVFLQDWVNSKEPAIAAAAGTLEELPS